MVGLKFGDEAKVRVGDVCLRFLIKGAVCDIQLMRLQEKQILLCTEPASS